MVENHPDTLAALERYLRILGHEVASATSMGEALAKIPDSKAEVLLSDIGLPDGDGWELLERLEEHHPRFAVAMSGFGMAADRERSQAAGFRHHLLKPFDPDKLDQMLHEAFRELHPD